MSSSSGPSRRLFLLSVAGGSLATAAGCNTDATVDLDEFKRLKGDLDRTIDEKLDEYSTERLAQYRTYLAGYALVSLTVAGRLVTLPHPAARIVRVALVVTGSAAKLAVDYLDIELQQRRYVETLDDDERAAIEQVGGVTFTTDNGTEETVYLAPTEYRDEPVGE